MVSLPPKDLETLLVLLENHGQVVKKNDLMQRLWPDTFVEEANLTRHISSLRQALSENGATGSYIETIPKRGYRFVAPVQVTGRSGPDAAEGGKPAVAPRTSNRKLIGVFTAVVAVALVGWFAGRTLFPSPTVRAGKIMLVVLPFENLSGDPEQEYFADGLTEEMITQLAILEPSQVGVIARASSMKYKQARKSVAEIGRELGVDYVLEGSVRNDGGRVRISAQLIEVRDQTHIWAQNYDSSLSGVIALQDDAATAIAREVQLRIVSPVLAARRRTPANAQAYEAYLKGRHQWNKRTKEGLKKGLEYFDEALAADPTYAQAHAGIADSYAMLASYAMMEAREAMPRAEAAAKRALELDETLPEAHAALAFALFARADWENAEKEFRRTIQLNPSYSTAHQWYARFLSATARHSEAWAEAQRATELDPFSTSARINLGFCAYYGRRYDQAIEEMKRVLQIAPDQPWAHLFLAMSYFGKGMTTEGVAEAVQTRPLSGGRPGYSEAYGHALSGHKVEARRILSFWKGRMQEESVEPLFLAGVHAALGEHDEAFAMLDQEIRERKILMPLINVEPWLDPLRPDPRFQELLRRLNLPVAAATASGKP
jgi:TolB-like protein/DNA-binding winged helix-turn-helix (wHTH) protein/Tfp pilus assembly protein PilF